MPQNDPANNPEWNPKEKHQFFLAKSARLGSKKGHQKYILTIEAQSFFENIVYLLITLLVQNSLVYKILLLLIWLIEH